MRQLLSVLLVLSLIALAELHFYGPAALYLLVLFSLPVLLILAAALIASLAKFFYTRMTKWGSRDFVIPAWVRRG